MRALRISTLWLLVAALLVTATAVFASGQGETGGSMGGAAQSESKTIAMWTFLDPAGDSPREQALRQIIANFEEKHPNIDVIVEPQDFAIMPSKF